MKKIIIILFFAGIVATGFSQQKIQPDWQDFSTTINAMEQDKITMIYVYNNAWDLCTTAEETILSDTTVVNALKKDFISIKFDSETKEEVIVKGKPHPYLPSSETHGVNMYTIILLDGRMGYPTYVFLDTEGKKLGTHFPVNNAEGLLLILKYYSSGGYKDTPYEEWIKKQ
jgi:thioredoxin-related protein